jgi:hypothetical protein
MNSKRLDGPVWLVLTAVLCSFALFMASCGVQGRFYAERGALEALPNVWIQIEKPNSQVKGTITEAKVHTGGHTFIYNVEVVWPSHTEAVYQREIPSRLPWDPSIQMGAEHPDDVTVQFKIPETAEGSTNLVFRISYVWAHVTGATTYENNPRTDEVKVTLHVWPADAGER